MAAVVPLSSVGPAATTAASSRQRSADQRPTPDQRPSAHADASAPTLGWLSSVSQLWSATRVCLFIHALTLLAAAVLGTELLHSQMKLYGLLLSADREWIHWILLFGAAGLGLWRALARPVSFPLLAGGLLAWALSTTLSASVVLVSVPRGWLWFSLPALCAAQSAALCLTVVAAWRTLALPALQLGLVSWAVRPTVLVPFCGLFAALLVGLSRAGIAYYPAVLGLLLSGLLAQLHAVRRYLQRVPLSVSYVRAALLTTLVAAASLVGVSQQLPLEERRAYAGQVLYATGDQNSQRVVLATHAAGVEIFVDHRIHLSALDASRYYEALSGGLSDHDQQVLLLGPGSGLWASRLQRHAELKQLVVVTPSLELADLVQHSPGLAGLVGNWRDAPGIELVQDEFMPFLTHTAQRFDLILADLPAPIDHRASKHYTRRFVELLTQHLRPSGRAVLPAFSPSRTPEAHAAVLEMLSGYAFELRIASLPSLGDWAFVVLHATAAEQRPDAALAPLSTLHTQSIGYLFRQEYALNNDFPVTE